jgi:hypothetical protein
VFARGNGSKPNVHVVRELGEGTADPERSNHND